MPTTLEEANKIVSISQEYVPLEKLKDLFIRLDDEVGRQTDNDSLKKSIAMMRLLLDPPRPPTPWWLWMVFYLLVVGHLTVVFGIFVAFFYLPFAAPWYIALPLMAFVFFFATTRVDCRLTDMENALRRKLGKKTIPAFVGFYMVKPIKNLFKKYSKET